MKIYNVVAKQVNENSEISIIVTPFASLKGAKEYIAELAELEKNVNETYKGNYYKIEFEVNKTSIFHLINLDFEQVYLFEVYIDTKELNN